MVAPLVRRTLVVVVRRLPEKRRDLALELIDSLLRLRGLRELRLYTNAAMSENIAMYGRLGWEQFSRREEGPYSRVYFRKPATEEGR